MTGVPTIELNNGVTIPQLGFGVFLVPPGETEAAVATALSTGYRHIDTASSTRTRARSARPSRRAASRATRSSSPPRSGTPTRATTPRPRAFDKSLERLGFDYVDLYLIHWPLPKVDRYVETWRALEKIAGEGRARAIGVSNFQIAHLQRLIDETGTVPAVNQVELHPHLTQAPLRAFHAQHGIVTEAWSPLARGGSVLTDPRIAAIAPPTARPRPR